MLLGIFAMCLSFTLPAQVDLTWGDDIDGETNVLKILGLTETGHYALTNRRKDFFVEHFSGATMTRDFTTELEFREENGLKSELANIFYLDGQLVLLTVAYDRPNKVYNIYGYLLDEKGKISSDRKDIITVEVDKGKRRGEFDIKLSRDRSKILVLHTAPHREKAGVWTWELNGNILSSSLQSIKTFKESVDLKDEEDYLSISNFVVGNDATVYIAVRQVGWERSERLHVTRSMFLYQYAPTNGFELKLIPLEIGDKRASSVGLAFTPEGDLVGGGFYSERNQTGLARYEGLVGSYFFRVGHENGEVEKVKTAEFGKEFAGQILKEKKADKGKLVPNAFIPRQVIPRTDGGAVMIAEFYTVTVTRNRNTINTRYYHGPLAIVNLNANGTIDWVKALPKMQIYTRVQTVLVGIGGWSGGLSFGFDYWISLSKDKTVYHSYLLAVKNDELHFIYNDNPKNTEIVHTRETNILNGYNGAVPVAVKIDGEGNITKELLAEKDRKEVVLRPKISFQEDYGDIIIFGNKKKKDKFGLIQY
jgi:hypothetical protein